MMTATMSTTSLLPVSIRPCVSSFRAQVLDHRQSVHFGASIEDDKLYEPSKLLCKPSSPSYLTDLGTFPFKSSLDETCDFFSSSTPETSCHHQRHVVKFFTPEMDNQANPREADTCRGIKGGKPADGFIQGR
jgi:hypothetical protein